VKPVINAAATLTKLGGSLMPPVVIEAMLEGSKSFVDWVELQRAVGRRIAELTDNEACYVSSGAAGGILLSIASVIAGTDPEKIAAFPYLTDVEKKEIIIVKSQRNGYDYAVRQTGATLIEIGDTHQDLEQAFSPRTAAVIWFAGKLAATSIPIADAVGITHAPGVPFIVDGAAQIPPVSNLRDFTNEVGADLAIFSGGKGMCGPQSSGLVLGRADLIEGCIANGSPHSSIGRPAKVGKEELFGVLAALEWTLSRNEPEVIEWYEGVVRSWIAAWAELPGISAERGFPNEAGQPFGRVMLTFGDTAKLNRDAFVNALWEGDPKIAVSEVGLDQVGINPQTVQGPEVEVIAEAVRTLLQE
jgi:L-seryl-tRNA(Ser) seleniumtransferase